MNNNSWKNLGGLFEASHSLRMAHPYTRGFMTEIEWEQLRAFLTHSGLNFEQVILAVHAFQAGKIPGISGSAGVKSPHQDEFNGS